MKVNKFIPLALLAVSALSACGGSSGGTSSNKLMIWCAAQEREVVQSVLNAYNESHPEKQIPYNIMNVEEPNTADEFTKNPKSKNAPDLFLSVDDKLLGLSANGLITEIQGKYKDRTVAANSEKAIKNSSIDGKLYGFPICADNGYFLYYNKKFFNDAAGTDALKNLNDLMEYVNGKGKKLFFNLNNGFYSASLFASPDVCGIDSMHYQLEGNMLNYHAAWDTAEGAAMAEEMAGIFEPAFANGDGYLVGATDDTNIHVQMAGENPEIIAAISGVWKEKSFQEAVGEGNLGAVKMPTFTCGGKDHQMASFSGSKVWCINNRTASNKKRMAVAAAELLTSKDAQLLRFKKRLINPSNKAALQDPEYTNNKGVSTQAFIDQDPYAIPQGASVETRYWDVGKDIGMKLLKNELPKESGTQHTWQSYLTSKMTLLKNKKPYKA